MLAATEALAGGNLAAQIERVAAMPEGRLREKALAGGLVKWAEEDPAAAYAQLSRLAAGRLLDDTRREVLRKLAVKDAPTALSRLDELLPTATASLYGNPLINEILRTAAEKNVSETLKWATAAPDAVRADAIAAVLVGWVPKEPIAALEWAHAHGIPLDVQSRSPVREPGFVSWQTPIQQVRGEDIEKVVAWLRELSPSQEQARMLATAVRNAPVALAREVFDELPLEQQTNLVWPVAESFAGEDLAEGMKWAQGLQSGAVRARAIESLFQADAGRFPGKIEALLDQFADGADHDAALRGYALASNYKDSDRAIELAGKIGDTEVREQTFRNIVTRWFYRDAPAASKWIETTRELTPAAKEVILRQRRESQVEWGR
jgi:hypothetical protein